MPEYLHPGVFVEEVSSGVRPIEGVGTSTAGFVGITAKGVPNKATFITTWAQFVRAFGYLIPNSYLPYAVSQFFSNGGKRCYVVRALNQISSVAANNSLNDRETAAAQPTLRVQAKGAGGWGNGLIVIVQNGTNSPTTEFKLIIAQDDPANTVELWDNLSMDPSSLDYVETSINDVSDYIQVTDLKASIASKMATATTLNPLANPVPFAGGGETLIIETTDGTQNTLTFTGNTAPADVVSKINAAWAPFNVSAAQDGSGKLVLTLNTPGYDKYFILSGTATAAGRPLEGLAGFAQGSGPAIPAILKSTSQATFDTSGGKNVFKITVHGDALPDVNVTSGAAVPASTLVTDFNTEFATKAKGTVRASLEGQRVVISTVNTGAADTGLQITGAGEPSLTFRRLDRGGVANDIINGQGRSDPALVQSAPGPFAFADNSAFTIATNNGVLGAATSATVNITSAVFPNLAQVTAAQLVASINGVAAGNFTASAEGNTVVIRSARKGPFYTLTVTDGTKSPNIQMRFSTVTQTGYAEGDATSPYFRPAVGQVKLLHGDDGGQVTGSDLIGSGALKTGIHAFDDVKDVNFIAIPGASDPNVVSQAVGYCTVRHDCFFIADPPGKVTKDTPTEDPPKVLDYLNNHITTKTSYGGLYYPWMLIADDVGAGKNPTRYVPPSGFIAGLYARIDNTRGVWKAPAGTEASVIGPISLEYSVTDAEQDILNPAGVNCIRQFAASGIVVWGARTLSTRSDPEWRYVPVRRYAIYLEQSIYYGTQWAVFEPNDETLWASLKANIEDFMMGEFRKGALAGATPDKAFKVKCDADLNPPSEVNAGRVNMEVHFAPLKPAEFVIIRISQLVQRPSS
jgi:phage tail sheath protein FI